MKIIFYVTGGRMVIVGTAKNDKEIAKVIKVEQSGWDKSTPRKFFAIDAELVHDDNEKV